MRTISVKMNAIKCAVTDRYWHKISGKVQSFSFYDKEGNQLEVAEARLNVLDPSEVYKMAKEKDGQ